MKQRPLLSIVMAHYDDWDGVYFTLQAIATAHDYQNVLHDVEIIIVDNSPHLGKTANAIKSQLARLQNVFHSVKYMEFEQQQGTSGTRDAAIRAASGEWCMCIDCHILLYPKVIPLLLRSITQKEFDTKSIYGGVMVHDDHRAMSTHFNPEWRDHMWGTWGQAWISPEGAIFQVINNDNMAASEMMMSQEPIKIIKEDIAFAGHEMHYENANCVRIGNNPSIVEVPGQGLGLFLVHTESWLGFNPDCRGFGGEELYIHEKYRQHGGKAMCIGWLKWVHRFFRDRGNRYPLRLYDRVRNYILEFNELGLDLDPLYRHFVLGEQKEGQVGTISEEQWLSIKENPKHYIEPEPVKQESVAFNEIRGGVRLKENPYKSIDDLYEQTKAIQRDLNLHMDTIKAYALRCKSAAELSDRKESSIALLAGNLERFISYNPESNPVRYYPEMVSNLVHTFNDGDPEQVQELPEKVDLLFLDVRQTEVNYKDKLDKLALMVNKYIIIHDTGIYGMRGVDGRGGIMMAMQAYMRDHQEWSIVFHSPIQYGLTVMSKVPEEKPKLPSTFKKAANLAKAVAEHIAAGGVSATTEVYEKRLDVCAGCEFRNNTNCSVCGCVIAKKAGWSESKCPLDKWED